MEYGGSVSGREMRCGHLGVPSVHGGRKDAADRRGGRKSWSAWRGGDDIFSVGRWPLPGVFLSFSSLLVWFAFRPHIQIELVSPLWPTRAGRKGVRLSFAIVY